MKNILSTLFVAAFLLSATASCTKKEETTMVDSTTSIPGDAAMNAIEEVASDKEKLRQAIILADSKGTLEAALTEAAQDSIIRDKLRNALAAAGGASRTASNATGSTSKSKATASRGTATTPQQKKDALDQANDALDKTNRTIERTNQTVTKAEEAARRADELLRRKK